MEGAAALRKHHRASRQNCAACDSSQGDPVYRTILLWVRLGMDTACAARGTVSAATFMKHSMRFRVYQSSLNCQLSDVKLVILQRLWDEGMDFPRGWVSSSALLVLTKQKYFDRRVRELRDEVGCDIETVNLKGEHSYRLRSARVLAANPRAYLSAKEKRDLFERAGHCCAVCGRNLAAGIRGLQADHKVPLMRGGSHDSSNWQPLCVECNVAKRRVCAGCKLDCKQCPWAYPDRIGRRVQLTLAIELESRIQDQARRSGKSLQEVLIDVITAGVEAGERRDAR